MQQAGPFDAANLLNDECVSNPRSTLVIPHLQHGLLGIEVN